MISQEIGRAEHEYMKRTPIPNQRSNDTAMTTRCNQNYFIIYTLLNHFITILFHIICSKQVF